MDFIIDLCKNDICSYLDRLKHNVPKILAFIVIIYGACIMPLYQSYQDKADINKA